MSFRHRRFLFLLLIIVAIPQTLRAEDEDVASDEDNPPVEQAPARRLPERRKVERQAPSQTRRLKPRTLANLMPNDYGGFVVTHGEAPRDSAKRPYEIHLGAATGVSTVGATSVDPGVTNLALNATADARFFKYLGAEVDVHGDLVSAKYNGINSTAAQPTSKVSRDYVFAVKGQYPFWADKTRITPKIGVGYGYTATNYTNPLSGPAAGGTGTSTAAADSNQLTEVSGVFGLLGVDVDVTPEIVLFTDYAHSMTAQGAVTINNIQTSALTGCGFDRFRLGGYYRMGPSWGLGAQFVRRSASYDTFTGTAGSSGDTQMQFLGLVMFEL